MDDIKALLINTDGTTQQLSLSRDTSERLDALQQHVGGLIEAVHILRDGADCADAIVNDEGKILGLEPNELATDVINYLATETLGPGLFTGDYIAGPAVLMGCPDSDGIETDIPEDLAEQVEYLSQLHRRTEGQEQGYTF